jgi:hypothetical protein
MNNARAKGVVYLQRSGACLTENAELVTKPCNMRMDLQFVSVNERRPAGLIRGSMDRRSSPKEKRLKTSPRRGRRETPTPLR